MRSIVSGMLIITLTACSDQRTEGVDERLQPYFDRFQVALGVSVGGLVGAIENLSPGIAAQCELPSGSPRVVRFDNARWNVGGDSYKEQVVFHELGHCIMNLDHDPAIAPNGCPVSIMYPVVFGVSFGGLPCYFYHKAEYYDQLKVEPSRWPAAVAASEDDKYVN